MNFTAELDVVNRGFSGYNTSHALRVLPSIIQPPTLSKIRLMVCIPLPPLPPLLYSLSSLSHLPRVA